MNTAVRTLFLASAGLLAASSVRADAILTCTAPGFSFTGTGNSVNCTIPVTSGIDGDPAPIPLTANATESLTHSGNQIVAAASISVNPDAYVGSPNPQSVNVFWSDQLDVYNNPSDIWDISLQVYGFQSAGSVQIGQYSLVPNIQCVFSGASGPCVPTRSRISIDAPGVPVTTTGDFSLTILYGELGESANAVNYKLYETITRFEADGVTPDPFIVAPEPASLGLLSMGTIMALAFAAKRVHDGLRLRI